MEEGLGKPLVSAGACAMEILQLCTVPVRVAGNVNYICLLPHFKQSHNLPEKLKLEAWAHKRDTQISHELNPFCLY